MSLSFAKSPAQCFQRSGCQARGGRSQIQAAIAIAAWPHQGFGTFAAGTTDAIATSAPGYSLLPDAATWGASYFSPIFTKNNTQVYRSIEYKLVVTGPTGYTVTKKNTYQKYWVNGFGSTTLVSGSQTGTMIPIPGVDFGIDSPAITLTPTQYTIVVSEYISTYPVTAGTYTFTYTATLSDPYNYVDALAACQAGLAAVSIPALPSYAGSGSGVVAYNRIWPDTGSTTAITVNSDNYLVAAANGMLSDFPSIATNGISFDLLARMVLCAKSNWFIRNKPFTPPVGGGGGYYAPPVAPMPPFELYNNPIDPSLQQQSVKDLLDSTPASQLWSFPIKSVPPFGFAGGYASPYDPPGLGEVGWNKIAFNNDHPMTASAGNANVGAGNMPGAGDL
ncbi:MAG: hypothetical protein P4N60_19105 [Verrucomicrobiae bacterium]|nr:hypothetical protein [Verrucomicrobiae bacterium]